MNLFEILVLQFIIFNNLYSAREVTVKCPSHCKCDFIGQHRRARCQNQKLVTVEAEIPPQVEVLDLSQNLVQELGKDVFFDQQLTDLKSLNLSHNRISQIHMNAFRGLKFAKSFDLSYNQIEYILINWLWDAEHLQELYLKKNNIGFFKNEPILESPSLKILDLSHCNLRAIPTKAFKKLPNLKHLDISGNLLFRLNVISFRPIKNLKVLMLEGNPWDCSNSDRVDNYCKMKKIKCDVMCGEKDEIGMFERMVRLELDPISEEEEFNAWVYDDGVPENRTIIVDTCSRGNTLGPKDLIIAFAETSPILTVLVPFMFGLAIGLSMTCFISLNSPHIIYRRRKSASKRSYPSHKTTYSPLIQGKAFEPGKSTPILNQRV